MSIHHPQSTSEYQVDRYHLDPNSLGHLLCRPRVWVDLHPFEDEDNHACLLSDYGSDDWIEHHHALDIVERILDGYDMIDPEELVSGSLVAALKNKNVRERIAGQRSFNFRPDIKTASVYLMESKGIHKIGFSQNPEKRAKVIQSKEKAPVSVVYSREVNKPYVLEQALHRRFRDERLSGEWFDLDTFDIDKAISLIEKWEGTE